MIFLRRAAHVVSILALLMLLAALLSASQAISNQGNQPNNSAPVTREYYESDMRALTEELRAIRNDIAWNEQERAKNEHPWYFGDTAPLWSNWLLLVITVGAGAVAYLAFTHQRDAVRLTQRADLLIESVGLKPNPDPAFLSDLTIISVQYKNFGPTRAAAVVIDIKIVIEGAESVPYEPMPIVVVAGQSSANMSFPPLGELFESADIMEASTGNKPMKLVSKTTYRDVFGKEHQMNEVARYFGSNAGPRSRFVIEQNDEES